MRQQRGPTGRAVPVSAPPRVRDLLRTAPDGPAPVRHRGRHALYVEVSGRCVGVLDQEAALVPCATRSRSRDFMTLRGDSAYLVSGVLHIDSRPLEVGRAVDVRAPRLGHGATTLNTASSATDLATPPATVVELVESLAPHGIDHAAVARLVGRGEGLTPLGDDVLCGWLATHRAAAVPTPGVDAAVRALLHGTTLLSATLLDCALHGEVLPEFGAWLSSLGTSTEPHRAAALLGVGATSGAGLMAGAHLALAELRREGTTAA